MRSDAIHRLPPLRFLPVLLAVAAAVVCAACDDGAAPVPPVAVVGPDMTVYVGDVVQLNGIASYDPDGDGTTLTYSWTLINRPAGSNASIQNPSQMVTSFTVDKKGTYVAQLIVNNGKLNSPPANCTLTTGNRPPVANAGADMTKYPGQVVSLEGAGSSDPDGDQLTYLWSMTKPPGSNAQLSSATAPSPTFTLDKKGQYVAQLIVNDGEATSAPDFCTITGSNRPPVANAGQDQQVTPGAVVQLNGSASQDPDADPLTYSWAFVSRPAGSVASLSSPSAETPTFTADKAGNYVLALTVHDGEASSPADQVTVTALAPPPKPGRYTGTTSEGKTITFVVAADGASIEGGLEVNFFFTCSFCSGSVKVTRTVSIPLSGGSFSYSSGSSSLPGHFAVAGDATSETTFSGTAAFRADPPAFMGCGSCSLASVTWTASWTGPAGAVGAEAAQGLETGEAIRIERDGYCAEMRFRVRG